MASAWEVRMSNSRGMPYFYNAATKEAIWQAPPGLTEEELGKLPNAHLLQASKTSSTGGAPGQVRASHLLIKHSGSRRPSSWKEASITRSKEEAIAILEKHQENIKSGTATFGELAKIHSDCSSHAKDGDLGWFGKNQMQKAFEDATYALQPGEMSDIVSTDSGVHLILRTA